MKKLLIATAMVLATVTTASATTAANTSDVAGNKEKVKSALTRTFADYDVTAVDEFFADPYIQHNPILPSGIAPLRGLVSNLAKGPKGGVKVHRMIGEGDLVVSHTTFKGYGPDPVVAFDIFRFDNGKIVEHWDNLMPVAKPNPSGHTQTDGATKVTDLDKTEANKAIVKEFIERAFIAGEKVDYTKFISPKNYTQHNPQVADGLAGLGAFIKYLGDNKIDFRYTKLHKLVGEGNFVMVAAEGIFGDKPTAYFDLFRLEDGLIVEHWDVVADMPSGKLPAGYPGKF